MFFDGEKIKEMKKMKEKTADKLAEILIKEDENNTIEGQLLKKKMIRELYKKIGEPEEKDFPDAYKHAYKFKKFEGYTTDIFVSTKDMMENANKEPTTWHIKRPSMTKIRIEEEYTREGWHCDVQAYNVSCTKYIKHPKHEKIWVRFYVSRDCAKYDYVLEK